MLNPLSEAYPSSIAQIFSGQMGTKGVWVDGEGRLGVGEREGRCC